MKNTLHILNGDSTLSIFNQCSIAGDTFVWREVLAEGPVSHLIGSDAFWLEREAFMTSFFELKPNQYREEVKAPFEQMASQITHYEEVVLWFEYDLFCQINMLALIEWLGQRREARQTISLVCAGKVPGEDQLKGLGQLNPEHYNELFNSRLKLNTREFVFAADVFKLYCSPQHNELFTYIILPSQEFPYLSEALQAHFRRFPYQSIGLNEIEQQIIRLAPQCQSQHQLVGKLLQWQTTYGFGDSQYFSYLNYLSSLFESTEPLKLKTEPELSSAINKLNRSSALGGTSLNDWIYDPQAEELLSAP
ncbi:MAG: hypothetical protein VYB44_19165 [Bacteroidota bacterium]|nr:hypothetical protein [Bacteroidota bacterium]